MNGLHRWLCASTMWKNALERKLLPWVLDGVALGDDLLEVGPGPGLTTDSLRPRVSRMTALEIDPKLAASLEQRLSNTNVKVVEGDGSRMPFRDNSFSSAVSLTMLHHVPTAAIQDKLLGEVYRVLKPGGWFVGTDNTWSVVFHLIHIGDTMMMVDPNTIGARLEAAGFDNVVVDRGKSWFRFRARKLPNDTGIQTETPHKIE